VPRAPHKSAARRLKPAGTFVERFAQEQNIDDLKPRS
jgi:hypothetical protein